MDHFVPIPAWAVESPELFRRLAARVDHFAPMTYPTSALLPKGTVSARCAHGYNVFADSCPNCDNNEGNT